MKKLIQLSPILLALVTQLSAKEYTAFGVESAKEKQLSCKNALNIAKEEALNQAGTFMISDFTSSTSVNKDDFEKLSSHKLRALSLGTVKVLSKKESVKVKKDYSFECRVDATFSIDEEEMKKTIQKYLESSKEHSDIPYVKAVGYSENGQTPYRAFKAATLDAKRNLLDEIKGSELMSILESQNGELVGDKVINSANGHIRYVKILSKEYNPKTQSATVTVGLSKENLEKNLKAWLK